MAKTWSHFSFSRRATLPGDLRLHTGFQEIKRLKILLKARLRHFILQVRQSLKKFQTEQLIVNRVTQFNLFKVNLFYLGQADCIVVLLIELIMYIVTHRQSAREYFHNQLRKAVNPHTVET